MSKHVPSWDSVNTIKQADPDGRQFEKPPEAGLHNPLPKHQVGKAEYGANDDAGHKQQRRAEQPGVLRSVGPANGRFCKNGLGQAWHVEGT